MAAAGLAQQTPAARLIAEARAQLDALNADSATTLLRQALAPSSGAVPCDRIRGYVLLGVTELIGGRELGAQLAFREALRLDPDLSVDTLTHLHSALRNVFASERAGAPLNAPRLTLAVLEIRGGPQDARVTVDGVVWQGRRGEVRAGGHHLELSARGYVSYRDSVTLDACAAVVKDVSMVRGGRASGLSISPLLAVTFVDPKVARRATLGDTTRGRRRDGWVLGLGVWAALPLSERLDLGVGVAALQYRMGADPAPLIADLSVRYSLAPGGTTVPHVAAGFQYLDYVDGHVEVNAKRIYAGLGIRRLLRHNLTLGIELVAAYEKVQGEGWSDNGMGSLVITYYPPRTRGG